MDRRDGALGPSQAEKLLIKNLSPQRTQGFTEKPVRLRFLW
jgi:hypothetical protein